MGIEAIFLFNICFIIAIMSLPDFEKAILLLSSPSA